VSRLGGRVALVTGGTSGIGEAAVRLFAADGARVSFCGRRAEPGRALERELLEAGRDVLFLPCDVSREEEVRKLIGATADRYGRLDVVLSNAGVSPSATVEQTSAEVWREVMDINVTGMFLVAKHAVPVLRRGGGGTIINVGSTYGVRGAAGSAAYAVSKAAAIGLTRTLALEVARDRIRVNALCPGAVATPLHQQWLAQQADPDRAQRDLVARHPWGRISTAEEQARAALFLACDDASFVTGHALLVDGGYTA
jgi:NAD(P)-dependent dehydrogenase (short-subunit alcohol dehydrogenase family)